MRTSSLWLLAIGVCAVGGVVGCSDPVSNNNSGDAGSDVPVNDVVADRGGGEDALPNLDIPLLDDAPLLLDVPVVNKDTPAPTDVGRDAAPAGDAGPNNCGVMPAVATYVQELSTTGWAAVNRGRSMMMHGCNGASRPQDCLSTYPLVGESSIGTSASAIPNAHLRLLYTASTGSNYWTRSSADGRFVGRGIRVLDLQRMVEITATGAQYDPAFFPDNSGYMYQPGGRLCPMSTLTTGMPTMVAVNGSSCVGSSVGLYEHLAASLGGEDYWSTSAGSAAFDDGGHRVTTTDPRQNSAWTANAQVSLSLMANTGSGYRFIANRNITTPYQGDAVISPSSQALATRYVDGSGTYRGFILHRLRASRSGSAISATLEEMGRYCTVGTKPSFSYDERYITYHHYIGAGPAADEDARDLGFSGADDSRFAEYRSRGASNIYVIDLVTGRRIQVTHMAAGQYALFPHFRSDGWMYFIVRMPNSSTEYVIASDALFNLS